jgi:hypothetical protein
LTREFPGPGRLGKEAWAGSSRLRHTASTARPISPTNRPAPWLAGELGAARRGTSESTADEPGTASGGNFVELADTLVDEFDVIDFLQVLVVRCVELLDVPAAGIMVADPGGSPRPVAASDERARLLELFEPQCDEGPCLDCYQCACRNLLRGFRHLQSVLSRSAACPSHRRASSVSPRLASSTPSLVEASPPAVGSLCQRPSGNRVRHKHCDHLERTALRQEV